MESLYFLILAAAILFIIFPFSFNIELAYDLKRNDGYFIIKVWRITLQSAGIKRKGKNIILLQRKDNKNLEVEVSSEQIRFLKTFVVEVKNKIRIRKLDVKTETGVKDPFKSAIFSSILSSIILSVFARLKTMQPTASFRLDNNTNFYDFAFDAKFFLRVSISVFDIFYSLILAVFKTEKNKTVVKRI